MEDFMNNQDAFNPEHDLLLERIVELTPAQMYRAWTTPELLMKWFCPKPWIVSDCKVDLKPGGKFNTIFSSPEGDQFPNNGSFLELIENKKIVFTDAFSEGFRPTEKPFMTATITFESHPQGTSYKAHVKHKDAADKKTHEDMGFHTGWNTALDQLIDTMKNQ